MSDSSITPEMPRSPEALAEGFANVGTMIDVDHSEVRLPRKGNNPIAVGVGTNRAAIVLSTDICG